MPLKSDIFTTKYVETSFKMIKVGYVVNFKNGVDESPMFGVIVDITLNGSEILFVYQQLTNLGFDDHYSAYKVIREDVFLIQPANFNLQPTYIFQGVSNNQFVNYN